MWLFIQDPATAGTYDNFSVQTSQTSRNNSDKFICLLDEQYQDCIDKGTSINTLFE